MLSFLRYSTRHCLWFPRDWQLPKLNPISSSSRSKGGKKTYYYHEPLWVFRLRQRLFCFAGRHRCPERGGSGAELDTWDFGSDGNRTCSYCGSIHYDDLLKVCLKTLVDERYGIEGTTKNYKVYIKQPGVLNAGQGAIKFYKWHAPANPSADDSRLFSSAVQITHQRWQAAFDKKNNSSVA